MEVREMKDLKELMDEMELDKVAGGSRLIDEEMGLL